MKAVTEDMRVTCEREDDVESRIVWRRAILCGAPSWEQTQKEGEENTESVI